MHPSEATCAGPRRGVPAGACTVVVCTRNRPSALDRCLRLLRETGGAELQVLVVDNAPEGDRARELAALHGAGYLVVPEAGLSRARNAGAFACASEIVVYLDDDAEPEPGWLPALLGPFHDPRVAACGGLVVWCTPDPPADEGKAVQAPLPPGMLVVDREDDRWYERVNFGAMGSGGNMAFRVSALREVSGFDERLGLGAPIPTGEDNYAFFALVRAGYRAVFIPDAVVRHPLPPPGPRLQERRARDLAGAVAYATRFLVEERGFRRATASYLLRSLFSRPRGWATGPAPRRNSRLGALAGAAATVRGVGWYLQDRLRRAS